MTKEQKLNLICDLSNKDINKSPIVIEFAGTPNSGKTSLMEELDVIFRRYKVKCKVICESAKFCKVSNKKSPGFNYWTALETIQKIIYAINRGYKIILCDRGIFDAITWMQFYYNSDLIKKNHFEVTIKFYLLETWKQFIQHIILMTCTPQIAIQRDTTYKEFKKYGTIINPETLKNINIAIEDTKKDYANLFNSMVSYDTTNDIEDIKQKIIDSLLTYLIKYLQ